MNSLSTPGHFDVAIENPESPVLRGLIDALCREMADRYGRPPSPFSSTEISESSTVFLVARREGDGEPSGCGGLTHLEESVAEIKRIYVVPSARGRGLGRVILESLESCAMERGYRTVRLETGVLQPEAQNLYMKAGYHRIPAFGVYASQPSSVCFQKYLEPGMQSPAQVVQRQLDAYNSKDLEGLLATYAENAEIYDYPSTRVAVGSSELRARFEGRFREPHLHAHLVHRVVQGEIVIDQEVVRRDFDQGIADIELLCFYEVQHGKIQRARFMPGAKNFDPDDFTRRAGLALSLQPSQSSAHGPWKGPTGIRIRRVHSEPGMAERLAEVLMDCVEGGASIGFMSPLSKDHAIRFWQGVLSSVARKERLLLIAESEDSHRVVGTVQVLLTSSDNQPHRAEILKMQVHRDARRQGVGEALLRAAEWLALQHGKTLLVLDTVSGGDAERLYLRLGWNRCGEIPNYALWPRGGFCSTAIYYKALSADSVQALKESA